MRKTLVLRDDDPAVRAWQRSRRFEDEREQASWLKVPFRMFVNVAFLGTLLQMEFAGMALRPALTSAAASGLGFAMAWMVLDFLFGESTSQLFLRALLIFSFVALWFSKTLLVSR